MPGTILKVAVTVGQSVKKDQLLCVLEAMKMKNAIRSGRAGTIARVLIKEGDSVQHSQVLMEYAD